MPSAPQLSVVAPCYNESRNMVEFIERVRAVFAKKQIRGELLLVNDGSTDDSGEIIDRASERHSEVVAVHHTRNLGIAEAWKSGLARAAGDYVCLIDSDLQYQPEDIARLFNEIEFSHADLVQGWRSEVGRKIDPRYYYSRALNLMLNLLFGMRLRDNKSGFVICRREVLEDVLRHRLRYRYFQSFVTVSAHHKGYTVRESEVFFSQRVLGTSFISKFPLRVIFGALADLPKAFVEFRLFEQRNTVEQEFLSQNPPSRPPETLSGWRKLLFRTFVATIPLHHWNIGWWAAALYRTLNATQWLSPAQIRELQELKLRRLVHHAYHHVHYYRELFDRLGLRPSDIRGLEDLSKLPLLDKRTIRENLHFNLMSDNHRKQQLCRITTSGSTGEPFSVFVDKTQLEMRWASTQRGMEWTGYRFGDRQARLWHQTIGMRRLQVIKERLAAWLSRRMFIPAWEMSDRNLPRTMRKLERFRPALMDGYAESFNFMAHYIKYHRLPQCNPRSIISSAQILPDDSRRLIEETFGCGVFDKYGSREFSGIAYECEAHEGKHVVAESYVVEILKDGRPAQPGEMGEVVITDLNNFCMPFIRYRIGDLAVALDNAAPCSCGRGLPRIGRIEGRVQSIILGADGRFLPGSFFLHFLKDYDYAIRQFQVIQDDRESIRLVIVKALRFNNEIMKQILDRLQEFVGREMRIDVEYVEEIPLGRTGKHRESVSQLNLDFQELSSGGDRG